MSDNGPAVIDVESRAITVRPQNTAVGQALGVDEIIAQVRLIQEVMGKVMQEGEHYGKIPGCGDKKTLLQPGAQKLTMTFRLAPEYQIQEADLTRGHKEYRVICTLKSIQSGSFVGQGVGCCSTMESKYRWRSSARKCPKCGKETIIKGKAEYGGGWLCYGKKGGCGTKWTDGAVEIESQSESKVENDNPADHFNTVLKMAKKRAFVDATITATAASDIFTQDIGDAENDEDDDSISSHEDKKSQSQERPRTSGPSARTQPTPAQQPAHAGQQARTSTERSTAKPAEPPKATEDQKARFLAGMRARFDDGVLLQWAMDRERPYLLPAEEGLEDWPLRHVPTTVKAFEAMVAECATFMSVAPRPVPANGAGAVATPSTSAGQASGASEAKPEGKATANHGGAAMDEPWFSAVVPIPYKGMKRDEYLKKPDTIGELYELRHDDEGARNRLFGFLHRFEPKGWVNRQGKQMRPSDSDIKFRADLDAFGRWFSENHPEELDKD